MWKNSSPLVWKDRSKTFFRQRSKRIGTSGYTTAIPTGDTWLCKICEMFEQKLGKFTKDYSLGNHLTRILETHAVSAAHKDANKFKVAEKVEAFLQLSMKKQLKKN